MRYLDKTNPHINKDLKIILLTVQNKKKFDYFIAGPRMKQMWHQVLR